MVRMVVERYELFKSFLYEYFVISFNMSFIDRLGLPIYLFISFKFQSAILSAIVFALGGNARMSNRGTANKGFVRSGQNSASVEITLFNEGKRTKI